ncbi:MAG TPA: TonB-dependent receptor [Novosphingobium sp.]|nr:TonB-dependent receptor [Novosphingobium sp.]
MLRATTAVLVVCAVPSFAQAQNAASGGADKGASVPEIIVTATRQESSAQKTGVALNVYSGETLQQQGVRSVADLSKIDPSLTFNAATGEPYLAIRGVSSADTTEIGDPAVPVARDGFFSNRTFTIDTSLYDLQRIEVLKGPQGTLFGRNAAGGLVSIVTAEPDRKLGGYLNGTLGDYSQRQIEGALNLPVSDRYRFRLAGLYGAHDGYRHLTGIGGRGDDQDVKSLRGKFAFEPVDHLKGLIAVQYDKVGGVGDVFVPTAYGQVPHFTSASSKTFGNFSPTAMDIEAFRLNWRLAYDNLPFGTTLTYLGGYDDSRYHHVLDASTASAAGALTAGSIQQYFQNEAPRTWNHEVRLSSAGDRALTWQLGFFNFQESNRIDSHILYESGLVAGQNLIHFNYGVTTISNAVFGQASYRILDNLKLSAGARWTNDEKTRTGNSTLDITVASGGFATLPGGAHIVTVTDGYGHLSASRASFHAGLEWQASPHHLVYAKFDDGYKPGGFNSIGAGATIPYGAETVKAFELGTKNDFFGRHLIVNLDYFHQNFDNYQANQYSNAVVGGGVLVENTGNAGIDGIEGELRYQSAAFGRLSVNATWLHTRFDNAIAADDQSVNRQIGGNRLPDSPAIVVAASYEHDFDLGFGTLTGHGDVKYSARYYYSIFNFADLASPATTTANLSVSFAPPSKSWSVQAYVRNVTDAVVISSAVRNAISGFNQYEFAAPRTFGVMASYKF